MKKSETMKGKNAADNDGNDDHSSAHLSSLFNVRDDASDSVVTPSITEFRMIKEDAPEIIRARYNAKMEAKSNKGNALNASDDSYSKGGKQDFYIYRQPQLNKDLWETKPRPYRNISLNA